MRRPEYGLHAVIAHFLSTRAQLAAKTAFLLTRIDVEPFRAEESHLMNTAISL